MSQSMQKLKLVSQELLQERLETVKTVLETDTEMYEVAKDGETGEHYLHYAYLHIHVAGDGGKEFFHQLMPLETDDVLAIVLGEQPFTYPDHWSKPFLRNGPDGNYVWFDPGYGEHADDDERDGEKLKEKLQAFKHEGSYDAESIQKLFEDLDDLWKDR